MSVRSHKDLVVWQKAMNLVECVYALTAQFPAVEKYRMVGSTHTSGRIRAGEHSGGSRPFDAKGLRTFRLNRAWLARRSGDLLILCERLGYATTAQLAPTSALVEEVGKMLNVLRVRLLPARNL